LGRQGTTVQTVISLTALVDKLANTSDQYPQFSRAALIPTVNPAVIATISIIEIVLNCNLRLSRAMCCTARPSVKKTKENVNVSGISCG
jgi:hypothetical protein